MLLTRHNPSNAILIIGSIAVTSNTIDSDSIHTNIIHVIVIIMIVITISSSTSQHHHSHHNGKPIRHDHN